LAIQDDDFTRINPWTRPNKPSWSRPSGIHCRIPLQWLERKSTNQAVSWRQASSTHVA